MSYEARIIGREPDTTDVTSLGISWDGDEYVSQGEIHKLTPGDGPAVYAAMVTDGQYAHLGLAAFDDQDECFSALLLSRRDVDRLVRHLPGLAASLAAHYDAR